MIPRPCIVKGEDAVKEADATYYQKIGSNPVTSTVYSKEQSYDWHQACGYDIRNFHKRKKAGEILPFTPWYTTNLTGTCRGSFISSNATSTYWCDENWNPLEGTWLLTPGELRAYTRLASPGEDVQNAAAMLYGQGFDTLTFTTELRKTIDMVFDLGQHLVSFLKKWRNSHNDWDSIWIESRYGWRVFAYEIQDINEAIKRINDLEIYRRERSGRTTQETFVEYVVQDHARETKTWSVTTIVDCSTRGTVAAIRRPKPIIFNPLLTTWEMIPFSFVIDWVIGIGTALMAASLDLTTEGQASASWKIRAVKTCALHNLEWKPDCYGDIFFESVCVGEFVRREPCGIPYIPFTQNRLNVDKLRDLLSLIRKILRRSF